MGKMAEPTDAERVERRQLARDIVESVEDDEEMPRRMNAEYEEACAALAQEITMLERERPSRVDVATPQEHPALTHRKMFATLVSTRGDGKPYAIGDLVCVDVPLNCTIESVDAESLTRMRVAAALLAPMWEGVARVTDDPSLLTESMLELIEQIVQAALLIDDMPTRHDT